MKIDPVSWRLEAPNAESVLVDVHHGCRGKTLACSGPGNLQRLIVTRLINIVNRPADVLQLPELPSCLGYTDVDFCSV